MPPYFLPVVIVLAAVLGPVLGAVHRNGFLANKAPLAHEQNNLAKDRLDLLRMALPKVIDGMVLRSDVVTAPLYLQVAPALSFQFTGGANAIQVTIDVQSEQEGGAKIRAAVLIGILTPEVEGWIINPFTKRIYHTYSSI